MRTHREILRWTTTTGLAGLVVLSLASAARAQSGAGFRPSTGGTAVAGVGGGTTFGGGIGGGGFTGGGITGGGMSFSGGGFTASGSATGGNSGFRPNTSRVGSTTPFGAYYSNPLALGLTYAGTASFGSPLYSTSGGGVLGTMTGYTPTSGVAGGIG